MHCCRDYDEVLEGQFLNGGDRRLVVAQCVNDSVCCGVELRSGGTYWGGSGAMLSKVIIEHWWMYTDCNRLCYL